MGSAAEKLRKEGRDRSSKAQSVANNAKKLAKAKEKLLAAQAALRKQQEDLEEERKNMKATPVGNLPQQITKKAATDQLKSNIKRVIRARLWGGVKFLSEENAQEQMLAGNIVFKGWRDMMDPSLSSYTDEEREAWIYVHWKVICSQLNDLRSNVVSTMRKAMLEWFQMVSMEIPTVEEMEMVAKRTIDTSVERNMEIMCWYWDKMLPAVVVNKGGWKEAERYFKCISESTYVTASTEAFLITTKINYRQAWFEQFALAKLQNSVHGKALKMQHRKKRPAGVTEDFEVNVQEKKIWLYGDQFRPLWVQNDAGNNSSGGWTKEGREKFKEYYQHLKKN